MPSYLVRVSTLLISSLACGLILPAQAGWGQRFVSGVLPSLARRAAISLIEKEIYDLEDSRSGGSNYQSISTPPPYAPPANKKSTSHHRPQPASTPPIGYQWTPRPAEEYLPNDDEQTLSAVPTEMNSVAIAFGHGAAGRSSFDELVKANVFVVCPLHGSVFKRESQVKYIILHSTETASPADARRVILSWNNRGKSHPGAQFVVDRDGTICSTTNPDMATVHINTSKTLPGYSNDNSVGIEIVRAGTQKYTRPQLDSVMHLVTYLQDHYHVDDSNVTTHHHVQPSDRCDPVGFDLNGFEIAKSTFQQRALAWHRTPSHTNSWTNTPASPVVASGHIVAATTMPQPAPDFRLLRRN